jgi:hypothetical protein
MGTASRPTGASSGAALAKEVAKIGFGSSVKA